MRTALHWAAELGQLFQFFTLEMARRWPTGLFTRFHLIPLLYWSGDDI